MLRGCDHVSVLTGLIFDVNLPRTGDVNGFRVFDAVTYTSVGRGKAEEEEKEEEEEEDNDDDDDDDDDDEEEQQQQQTTTKTTRCCCCLLIA